MNHTDHPYGSAGAPVSEVSFHALSFSETVGPFMDQVGHELKDVRRRDGMTVELGALSALHTAMHHAVTLGYLVEKIRRHK